MAAAAASHHDDGLFDGEPAGSGLDKLLMNRVFSWLKAMGDESEEMSMSASKKLRKSNSYTSSRSLSMKTRNLVHTSANLSLVCLSNWELVSRPKNSSFFCRPSERDTLSFPACGRQQRFNRWDRQEEKKSWMPVLREPQQQRQPQ